MGLWTWRLSGGPTTIRAVKTAILLHARLRPDAEPPWANQLLEALPYGRRLRLEWRPAPSRWSSVAGLALALWGAARLRGSAPEPNTFLGGDDEKPRFREGPAFSVAHAGDHVACLVAEGVEVGLDFEVRPEQDAPFERLRRWTATEAVLKAAGRGLRAFDEVRLEPDTHLARLDDARFLLEVAPLGPALVGHVASTLPLRVTSECVDLYGPEASTFFERSLGLAAKVQQHPGHA